MQFDGIIKSVQDRYDLDEVFRTSSCEYEEWDSPEKLCHLLFSAIPIIGEAKLSDEQISDFNKRGQHLFLKLITQGETSLSILERQMLSAAVIMHVQQLDDNAQESEETDSQLWDYILARVGYSESLCSKTTAYNRLRDVVHSTVHYATTHGKKYYNTLRIQALAPASSIFGLYNIIYRFYRVNLECQYEEAENAFLILAENIRKKVLKDSTADDIKLDSSVWALKSSMKSERDFLRKVSGDRVKRNRRKKFNPHISLRIEQVLLDLPKCGHHWLQRTYE